MSKGRATPANTIAGYDVLFLSDNNQIVRTFIFIKYLYIAILHVFSPFSIMSGIRGSNYTVIFSSPFQKKIFKRESLSLWSFICRVIWVFLLVRTNIPDIVKKQITAEMKDIFIRPDDVLEKKYETKRKQSPRN